MLNPLSRFAALTLTCCMLPAAPQQDARRIVPSGDQKPPRRLALVVGNASYSPVPLVNPVNDARGIAARLRDSAFFDVTEVENTDLKSLETAVDNFIQALRPGDAALFYYSGHGIQIDGENYLVPVNFSAKDETDAKYLAFSAQRVHDRMAGAGAALSILILDACRDNPFRGAKGGTHGWAPMQTGKGSFIAFATAPGATASDNSKEKNGLFTTYLLRALAKPALRIGDVFDETTDAVYQASGGKQAPWVAKSVVGNFVFRDPALEELASEAKLKRLQQELKAAEKLREQARTEQARRDAERAEQAAQAKLNLQRLEQERLAKEATRARDLEAGRQKLEADQEARLKEREKQRQETEARLTDLRRQQTAPQGSNDMTVEQARARVVELSKKLDETRKPVDAAKAAAVKKLADEYAPLRGRLAQATAKDEFETTAEYQARLAGAQKERQALEERYKAEQADIGKQFEAELEVASLGVSGEIRQLRERKYLQNVPVVWDGYDADTKKLTVHVGQQQYRFAIPPEQARQLAGKRDRLALQMEVAFEAGASLPQTAHLTDISTGDRFEVAPVMAGDTRRNLKDGLMYVWIPPGRFRMGCSPGDMECGSDEKPVREVNIAKGFWVGQTEVTQEAYQKVTGKSPSHFKGDRLPVENVNWEEAKSYCDATGGRLPTEAEWEYAARGGTTGARYGTLNDVAWYTENSEGKTHEVGQKAANGYGLYDMLGNVWEWVADWYEEGKTRSLRGYARVSLRSRLVPGYRGLYVGFRCVGE